jgi:hypothetical protein
MPRLSLYRPEKGNDYKFIDRQISELFQVGGTDIYVHKYLGPANPLPENATADRPIYDELDVTNIQDLLFLENRDRKYDESIYRIRGIYNVQDIDFNLSQFGLFIDNDTVYMTVHINDFIRTMGRKPLSGDVIEIPHLKDEFALNDFDVSLPRYFVISDVGRAAEGFSPTWYPHLYRLKLTKIIDSQQYKDIFDQKVNDDSDLTLGEILSTKGRDFQINDAVLLQAEADAPKSGYDTAHYYTLAVDERGNAALKTVDTPEGETLEVNRPKRSGYTGYLLGDGMPDNGVDFGHGITFPASPADGDYFLRTDFFPNRLFRFDGTRWVKREDAVRTTMTPTDTRDNQKGTFINNSRRTGVNLLYSDNVRVVSSSILTNVDYVSTMYATAAVADSVARNVAVANGAGNKAVIQLDSEITAGSQVAIKLYESSTAEKQALSKVLRPKADL